MAASPRRPARWRDLRPQLRQGGRHEPTRALDHRPGDGPCAWPMGAGHPGQRDLHSPAGLPDGRFRAQRGPVRQRLPRLLHAPERARRRDRRREDRLGRVRDAVRHEAGSRVLRAPEEQRGRRGVRQPLQHRHHVPAHSQGARRQGGHPLGRLRHDRLGGRPLVPVGVQLPDDLLEPGVRLHQVRGAAGRRPRQAQGEEDRPRLPQQPLREGSQSDARGALAEACLRADPSAGGLAGAGAEGDVAPGPADQPGLDLHLRAGA